MKAHYYIILVEVGCIIQEYVLIEESALTEVVRYVYFLQEWMTGPNTKTKRTDTACGVLYEGDGSIYVVVTGGVDPYGRILKNTGMHLTANPLAINRQHQNKVTIFLRCLARATRLNAKNNQIR